MSEPGRNDPCPCNSGKKYKKCCLGRRETAPPEGGALGPAEKALLWIHETFPGELSAAVAEDYFLDWGQERIEEARELPEGLREMLWTNANEWGLAEGLDPDGRRFIDLVLANDGPPLSEEDRRFLEALASTRLDLYEVVEVEPGQGIVLLSKTDPRAEPVRVVERTASQRLLEGDHLGARVLRLGEAILSGALYPFRPEAYLRLRHEIFRDGRRRRPEPEHVSFAIIEQWLANLMAPPPRMVDASTGEPIALTTVHYAIRDLERLRDVLDEEPDVVEEGENGWVLLDDADSDAPRPRCTLTRNEKGRLEVFARTLALADEAESWLAERAGDAVEKITREIVDPRHLWKARREQRPASPPNDVMAALSPEERTALVEALYRRTYGNWSDEPIPYLNGKSPRQAVRTRAGRREVEELLRVYERDERRRAEREGRAPTDLGFLRKELGLERT